MSSTSDKPPPDTSVRKPVPIGSFPSCAAVDRATKAPWKSVGVLFGMRCWVSHLQRDAHLGWILLLVGMVVVSHVATERPGPPERAVASANERFNEVLDRENLRTLISRQLPKQGRFFEEFDGSK
uniref:Uncharacterized protein n=1 Tax=Anopheles farauti TaxID=69004 RepID=A0A182Q209_9DIPT